MTAPQKTIALEGKDLQLGYSQKLRKEIFSDLSFQLRSGELTCLLGPNGVGKSTLIKAILGQISPWKGKLFLRGKDLNQYPLEDLTKEISVVLTDPVFPGNMTVGQLVALGRTPHTGWAGKLTSTDRDIVEKALSDTKIEYLKNERLGEISDGQRQKAMIARALAQDGQLMILDEPTAHLDLVNRFEVMNLLRKIAHSQQKAILVVTHDLEISIETADRFWIMSCGAPLLTGRPEDLILSGEINQLLPIESYRFSAERGRLEYRFPQGKYQLEGPEELIYWTQKALQKAGISTLPNPIKIIPQPFTFSSAEQTFSSLEELISFFSK